MKQLFILVLALISVLPSQSLFAQDAEVDFGNEGGNAILVATVNFESASLTQNGNVISVQFDLSNRERVQPDVRYGILLIRGEGQNAKVFDQRVWDEVLTLREGERVSRSLSYELPPLTEGEYDIFVVSENTHGLRFGTALAGAVTVSESTAGLAVDPTSCYLTTGSGESTKKVLPGDVIPSDLAGTIVGHCTVSNLGDRSEEVIPSVSVRERSVFGVSVAESTADTALRTISGGEAALISVPFPPVTSPQAYVADVSFGDVSAKYQFKFVTSGKSATIQSVIFDKDLYRSGEQAEVTLFWSGAADSVTELTNPVFQAEVMSGEMSCGASHMKSLEATAGPRITLTIPIAVDCENPTLEVSIIDADEGEVAAATFTALSAQTLGEASLDGLTLEDEPMAISISVIAAVLALIVLLFYAIIQLQKNNGQEEKVVNSPNIPPTVGPSLFFLLLLGGFVFFAQQASADTFYISSPTEVYAVTASLDKVKYAAGESMVISGDVQIASCACSGVGTSLSLKYNIDPLSAPYTGPIEFIQYHYLYDSTILYSTSTPAPAATGPHRIFMLAQTNEEYGWVYIPFSVAAAPAASCAGATVLNCTIPFRVTGGSGGSCQSGYYGTCSYTCSAGTFTENHNTCSFVRPDLASPDIMPLDGSSPSPSGGAEYSTIDAITFSGFVVNSNAKWVHQAGWADLEIENMDTSVVTTVNAYGGFELGSFQRNQVKDLTYTTTLPAGNYRYRFVVDTTNQVDESDESNNTSSWFDFTVVDAGNPCAATVVDACDLPITGTGMSAGSCTAGYTGSCGYLCEDGVWLEDQNTCAAPLPELTIIPTVPSGGENPVEGEDFMLGGRVSNSSSVTITPATPFSVSVELEQLAPVTDSESWEIFRYQGPGDIGPLGTYEATQFPLVLPGIGSITQAGDFRYRLTVDSLNEIAEFDETNNVSAWEYFSVLENTSCPATVIDGCVVPVNTSVNGGCDDGYVGACDYVCDAGSWTEVSNTCTPPLITTFEVCDADGVSNCTSDVKSVNPGESLVMRWDAAASMCLNLGNPSDFTTGGSVSGTDSVTANTTPLESDVYTLSCKYDDSLWVDEIVTVTTTGVSPVLQSSASIVNVGDTVTLTWDTNNTAAGGESVCTLTGGGIDSDILQTNGGEPELGSADVEIKGRSTFILRCDPSLDAAVVEIFPVGVEG